MTRTPPLPPLPPPTAPGPAGGGSHDDAGAAVAGLAREVEGLRRAVGRVAAIAERVDDLAALVARLADELAARPARPTPAPPTTWLVPPDGVPPLEVLGELTAWLGQVYLRYSDARDLAALPDCWLWHPDVVEELLWLMQAWIAAYQGPTASIAAAGDWHDRQRPGVVRRIRAVTGTCSLEMHPAEPAPPAVPLLHAVLPIADWWADGREYPAPAPTEDDHAAASRRRNRTRDPRGARR